MARQSAIELVEHFDEACGSKYIEAFSNYIGISVNQFWDKVHASVNPKLFDIQPGGRIARKFKVGVGL